MSGQQDMDFDQALVSQFRGAADTRQASNQATIALAETFAVSAAIAIFLLFYSKLRRRHPSTRREDTSSIGAWIMHTLRHRAALVICLGAAWIAADWLIFNQLNAPGYLDDLHDDHWFSFFGFCAMLLGIYHWITGPPTK